MSLEVDILKTRVQELVDEAERFLTVVCGLLVLTPVVVSLLVLLFEVPLLMIVPFLASCIGSAVLYLALTRIVFKPLQLAEEVQSIEKLLVKTPSKLADPFHTLYMQSREEDQVRLACSLLNVLSGVKQTSMDHYIDLLLSPSLSRRTKLSAVQVENLRKFYIASVRRLVRKWLLVLSTCIVIAAVMIPSLAVTLGLVFREVDFATGVLTALIPLAIVYLFVKRGLDKLDKELSISSG